MEWTTGSEPAQADGKVAALPLGPGRGNVKTRQCTFGGFSGRCGPLEGWLGYRRVTGNQLGPLGPFRAATRGKPAGDDVIFHEKPLIASGILGNVIPSRGVAGIRDPCIAVGNDLGPAVRQDLAGLRRSPGHV